MTFVLSLLQLVFPRLSYIISPILIIIILLIGQKFFIHNVKKMLLFMAFSLYLIAVFRITGLPDFLHLKFNPRLQLIPFYGMHYDSLNCYLNVFLFIPFWLFLPVLWREFFSFRNTLLLSLGFTVFIELSQLFCNRITDVNDIITNTFGALIGFCICRIFTKSFPKLFRYKFKKREFLTIFGLPFLVVFFLDPFVYRFLKGVETLPGQIVSFIAYLSSTV